MGQYYRVFDVDRKQQMDSSDFNCGNHKLMETCYIGINYTNAIQTLIHNGHRLVLCGDYAWGGSEDYCNKLKDMGFDSNPWEIKDKIILRKNDIKKNGYRYLINPETNEYVDRQEACVDWVGSDEDTGERGISRYDPTNFLLAVGNGLGGGDYPRDEYNNDKLGDWAGMKLEATDDPEAVKGLSRYPYPFDECGIFLTASDQAVIEGWDRVAHKPNSSNDMERLQKVKDYLDEQTQDFLDGTNLDFFNTVTYGAPTTPELTLDALEEHIKNGERIESLDDLNKYAIFDSSTFDDETFKRNIEEHCSDLVPRLENELNSEYEHARQQNIDYSDTKDKELTVYEHNLAIAPTATQVILETSDYVSKNVTPCLDIHKCSHGLRDLAEATNWGKDIPNTDLGNLFQSVKEGTPYSGRTSISDVVKSATDFCKMQSDLCKMQSDHLSPIVCPVKNTFFDCDEMLLAIEDLHKSGINLDSLSKLYDAYACNIKELNERIYKHYDYMYHGGSTRLYDGHPSYDELVDAGDEVLRNKKLKNLVRLLVIDRLDMFTSDREIAALYLAFKETGILDHQDATFIPEKDNYQQSVLFNLAKDTDWGRDCDDPDLANLLQAVESGSEYTGTKDLNELLNEQEHLSRSEAVRNIQDAIRDMLSDGLDTSLSLGD